MHIGFRVSNLWFDKHPSISSFVSSTVLDNPYLFPILLVPKTYWEPHIIAYVPVFVKTPIVFKGIALKRNWRAVDVDASFSNEMDRAIIEEGPGAKR